MRSASAGRMISCAKSHCLLLSLWSPWSWMTSPADPEEVSSELATFPLQLKDLFIALQILLRSRSSSSPWIVVMHLRPLRCWMRMWTLDFARPAEPDEKGSFADPKPAEERCEERGVEMRERCERVL
jgi:hypothetical protein